LIVIIVQGPGATRGLRRFKGILRMRLLLLACLTCAPLGAAEPLSPTAQAAPAALSASVQALSPAAQASAPAMAELSQPFGAGTLRLIEDYPLAPLHWDGADLLWATAAGAGIAVAWNNDGPLYRGLATGDARKDWLDHAMPAVSALGDGLMELGAAAVAADIDWRARRDDCLFGRAGMAAWRPKYVARAAAAACCSWWTQRQKAG